MLNKNRWGLGKKTILLQLETASALGQELSSLFKGEFFRPVGKCSQCTIEDDFKLHQDLNYSYCMPYDSDELGIAEFRPAKFTSY